MGYLTYLKELKHKRNMSSAEIAELANIPSATVSRIFSGTTPNPTFDTISAIAIAMGGSLDEMIGLRSADEEPIKPRVETTLTAYADLLNEKDLRIKEKDENIKSLNAEIRVERKEKSRLAFALFGVLATVVIFLIVDITNGHFGYFRY